MEATIKLFLTILAIFLVCLIQVSIIPSLQIWGAFANLILVAVLLLTLFGYFEQGFLWALIGGIFLDILASSSFGNFVVSLFAIYFILYFLRQKILGIPPFYLVIIFGFVGSLVFDFLYFGLTTLRDIHNFSPGYFSQMIFSAIFNSLLLIFSYIIFGWFKEKYLTKREIKI